MIGKVGKKGEIYIPKKLREQVNLYPGDDVLVEVKDKNLVIRKRENIIDVLKDEAISKVSVEELRRVREKISELFRS